MILRSVMEVLDVKLIVVVLLLIGFANLLYLERQLFVVSVETVKLRSQKNNATLTELLQEAVLLLVY